MNIVTIDKDALVRAIYANTDANEQEARSIISLALTAPVATEQAQAVAALRAVQKIFERDVTFVGGGPDAHVRVPFESHDQSWNHWHEAREIIRTALAASTEAAPAAPLLMQDENSGREGRRYNEWHASRPDARLNAREAAAEKTDADAYCELAEAMGYPGGDACMLSPEEWAADLLRDAKLHRTAATPAAPSAVTDAMIDAYLKANDAYWKRTDELPKSGAKWRNGTPREATRESLLAALAQPAPVQVAKGEDHA